MELTELGAEDGILEGGEDLIADPLVKGHSAFEGILFMDHS